MNALLLEGLTDAAGFVAGGLLGLWLTRALGLDVFAAGYSNASVGGILVVGLCCGASVYVARRLRAALHKKKEGE